MRKIETCHRCKRARWTGEKCRECDLNVVEIEELKQEIEALETRIYNALQYPNNTWKYGRDLLRDQKKLEQLREDLNKKTFNKIIWQKSRKCTIELSGIKKK